MDGDAQPWSLQEKALHEARLKAKGKRRLRRTSSRDSPREGLPEKGEPEPEPSSPKGKNHDRKSRMGKGRGLPKKGRAAAGPVRGAALELGRCCPGSRPDSPLPLSRRGRGQRRLGSSWACLQLPGAGCPGPQLRRGCTGTAWGGGDWVLKASQEKLGSLG